MSAFDVLQARRLGRQFTRAATNSVPSMPQSEARDRNVERAAARERAAVGAAVFAVVVGLAMLAAGVAMSLTEFPGWWR